MAGKQKGKNIIFSENNNLEKRSRVKAIWDSKVTKIFIELCKDDLLERNRLGGRVRNPVWKGLLPKFNELARRKFEPHQLKNKWDGLKRDWKLWKVLISNDTGLGWDSAEGAVVDDKWWEARLKVVPKAAKFQNRAPEFINDLDIIFAHTVAGESWSPSPISIMLVGEDNISKDNYFQLKAGSGDSGEEYIRMNDPQLKEGSSNNNIRNNIAETGTFAKPEGGNDEMKKHKAIDLVFNGHQKKKKARSIQGVAMLSGECDRFCEVVESRCSGKSSGTSMITKKGMGSSIAEVMELMESIPEIEPASKHYMLGTRLFIKRENREMFVALKTPHIRLAWLNQELAREGQTQLHV